MKLLKQITAVAVLATLVQTAPVLAQSCSFVWEEARARIASECTDSIHSNTMCYGYETLVTEPSFPDFTIPGQQRPIDRNLVSVQANLDGGLGGFSFLKVIAGKPVQGLPIGQAVIMIAFGDTGLQQIVSRAAPLPDARALCTTRLRPGSTTFGGSYIRAVPDARHRIECASQPCEDKNNLLYLVGEGEPLDVLGRDAAGSTLLVSNHYATGWMSAAPSLMALEGCSIESLPAYPDDTVISALNTQVDLPVTSQFVLVNTPTAESMTCLNEHRPPGGLLILNASHQNLVFSVNSIEISIASSVLITSHWGVTRIFVLQGRARAVTPQGQAQATSGETIAVVSNRRPFVLQPVALTVGWCDGLHDLAAAAYGLDPRLPDARIDYCATAPNGYPAFDFVLSRLLSNLDRPNDGLSGFER